MISTSSTQSAFRLDEGAVLAAARERTGLDDLYEAGLDDRLTRLLAHLDTELGLDEAGKRTAFDAVLELVVYRALMLADRERYPEITKERIERPIFITGLPRSGTTLLHALFAEHPDNRAPLWWEVMRPSPPPGISPPDDPRIALTDRDVTEMLKRVPIALQFHPYFDRLSQTIMECEAFGSLDFRNVYNPSPYFRVPAVLTVQLGGDDVALYEFQRKALQALQWRRPRRRWALKGTEHHARLDALKEVFPDAIVIWVHRDPLKSIPSIMELLHGYFSGMAERPLDRNVVGPQVVALYKSMTDAALASPVIDDPDTCHVQYTDFVTDPIGQVRAVCNRYDLGWTAAAGAALKTWIEDPFNKGNRHGGAKYSLELFQMTEAELDANFTEYRERFGIPYE